MIHASQFVCFSSFLSLFRVSTAGLFFSERVALFKIRTSDHSGEHTNLFILVFVPWICITEDKNEVYVFQVIRILVLNLMGLPYNKPKYSTAKPMTRRCGELGLRSLVARLPEPLSRTLCCAACSASEETTPVADAACLTTRHCGYLAPKTSSA